MELVERGAGARCCPGRSLQGSTGGATVRGLALAPCEAWSGGVVWCSAGHVRGEGRHVRRGRAVPVMRLSSLRTLSWISWSMLSLVRGVLGEGCPHPPVPAAATYVNVTGGLGQGSWHVRYVCNIGESEPGRLGG